jgi:hypothetical protein
MMVHESASQNRRSAVIARNLFLVFLILLATAVVSNQLVPRPTPDYFSAFITLQVVALFLAWVVAICAAIASYSALRSCVRRRWLTTIFIITLIYTDIGAYFVLSIVLVSVFNN